MFYLIMKLTLSSLFVLLFSLMGFVSAQYSGGYGSSYGAGFFYGTEQVINSLVENLEPLLRALFGGQDWTGYLLFEKTLLFIIIAIIIGLVLENLPVFKERTSKGILRLVAVIIGILAVRGINFVWINTILVQYQALFIAITGILPFMIYWAFVKEFDSAVRKIAWIFYAVVYFGLWITADVEAYESVYLWGALVALAYGFFIDKSVQAYLDAQKVKAAHNRSIWSRVAENNEIIRKEESKLESEFDSKVRDALKDKIKTLHKHNSELRKQID